MSTRIVNPPETDAPRRPRHRATPSLFDDLLALADRRRPAGRHRAPEPIDARLERSLAEHGYSLPRLLAARPAGGPR